jgi:hypothetical protein
MKERGPRPTLWTAAKPIKTRGLRCGEPPPTPLYLIKVHPAAGTSSATAARPS